MVFVVTSVVLAQEVTKDSAHTIYRPDPNLLPILVVMSILTIFTNSAKIVKTIRSKK